MFIRPPARSGVVSAAARPPPGRRLAAVPSRL